MKRQAWVALVINTTIVVPAIWNMQDTIQQAQQSSTTKFMSVSQDATGV